MKIAISGSEGQLGLAWQAYLSGDLNVSNTIPSTVYPGYFESIISKHVVTGEIVWIPLNRTQFDLSKPELVEKVLDRYKPDILVNTAAYTKVDQAEEEKAIALEINAEGVAILAKACKKRGIRLIHYSTDYVFPGEVEDAHLYPQGYPESASTNPINVYGETKLKGEQALLNIGGDFLILRVSWLCGFHGNNFLKTIIHRANTQGHLKVVNDQIGVPTFTEEVVRHTLELIQLNIKGLYHLGSKGVISWYDFAKQILEYSEVNIPLEAVTSDAFPTKAKRPMFSKLSTSKLEELGIEVRPWQNACKRVVSSLKDH